MFKKVSAFLAALLMATAAHAQFVSENGSVPITASAETYGYYLAPTVAMPSSAVSGGIQSGFRINQQVTGNGSNVSGGDLLSAYIVDNISTTGTLPYAKGLETNVVNNGSGTIGFVRDYYSNITQGGGGTINTLAIYGGGVVQNNGSIGTLIHLICDGVVAGQTAPGTEYCVYNSNPSQINYTAGETISEAYAATGTGTPGSSTVQAWFMWDANSYNAWVAAPNGGNIVFGDGNLNSSGIPAHTLAIIPSGGGFNLISGAYESNGTAGVSCSGAPTASFTVTNGIVTHC